MCEGPSGKDLYRDGREKAETLMVKTTVLIPLTTRNPW